MKKCTYFFLAFAYLTMLVLAVGCGDKCSGCPEDVEFPAEMELRIPYQVGQVVRFANAAGDTIVLNCTSREYSQEERFAMERPQSECCPSYFVEKLQCELSDVGNNYLKIGATFGGVYIINITGKLDGIDYNNGGLYEGSSHTFLDSIRLTSKTYYNVSTAEMSGERDISMFLGFDGQGVVGFVINGEEWALIS